MISKKQMEALLTVAQEGNITRAAKKLYVSQPALSQMILGIERELGTPLFDRDAAPMHLTYAGEKYLAACIQIRSIYESATRQIEEIQDGSIGRITLGMSLHMSIFISHKILPRFFALYPKFDVKLMEGPPHSLAEMVLAGQVDLALVYQPQLGGLSYQPIAREKIYLAAPPFFYHQIPDCSVGVNNRALHMREVYDSPFILLKRGHGVRTLAEKIFSDSHCIPRTLLETDSIEVAHRLAKENLGFTFVPSTAIYYGNYVNTNGVYFPVADSISERELFVCFRKDTYRTRALDALIEIIADAVRAA